MKTVSLFSGIGGLDLGLEDAGHEIVMQVESDPYCCQVCTHDVPRKKENTRTPRGPSHEPRYPRRRFFSITSPGESSGGTSRKSLSSRRTPNSSPRASRARCVPILLRENPQTFSEKIPKPSPRKSPNLLREKHQVRLTARTYPYRASRRTSARATTSAPASETATRPASARTSSGSSARPACRGSYWRTYQVC
jgi:hypothetical protein